MTGRTVLITGTSTGIGAACVARLAPKGWRVYAGVRREEDGERLAASVDGDVVPVMLDVTDEGHVDAVLGRIRDEVGSLDGLVNNAGVAIGGPVELLPTAEWRRQFEINVFGLITLTREAMPLVDRADGRFVHIGSIAGRVTGAGIGPYSASKHALEALNWAMRAELTPTTGMTSSLVEPGEIRTSIWDKAAGQLGRAEEALRAAGLHERYGFLMDRQRGFVDSGASNGIDAARVADAVHHALTSPTPRARYLVGRDARTAAMIARLPDRLRERLLAANARRHEARGRELR